MLRYFIERESWGVVVICDGQNTKILVIVGCRRSVADYGSEYAIAILSRPVRVVPARAELGSLEYVLASLSGGDWAFRDARDSILLTRVVLTNTVPVDSSAVVLHAILDIDNNSITPFGPNSRTWVLIVDQLEVSTPRASIQMRFCHIGNFKVVLLVVRLCTDRKQRTYSNG